MTREHGQNAQTAPHNVHIGRCIACKRLLPKQWLDRERRCGHCVSRIQTRWVLKPRAREMNDQLFLNAVHEICKRMKPSEGLEDIATLARQHRRLAWEVHALLTGLRKARQSTSQGGDDHVCD